MPHVVRVALAEQIERILIAHRQILDADALQPARQRRA